MFRFLSVNVDALQTSVGVSTDVHACWVYGNAEQDEVPGQLLIRTSEWRFVAVLNVEERECP